METHAVRGQGWMRATSSRLAGLVATVLSTGCAAENPSPFSSPAAADVGPAGPAGFTRSFAATDPRLRIHGRTRIDARGVAFDWPGVYIVVSMRGPSVAFELEDEGRLNYFNVFVDGARRDVWRLKAGVHTYEIGGLGPDAHEVVLAKRTEAYQGITTFRRVWLPEEGSLLPAPAPAARRLELVGASWIAGYGNEGDTHESCPNLEEVSNNWEAFGVVAARRLGAEFHVVAASGMGVVRNAGDPSPRSREPFPDQYDRRLWNEPDSRWDFSAWVPHALVVDLGINDHTTDPRPPADDFQAGYAAFLRRLRRDHPQAHLFCVNVRGWPHFSALTREVVETLRRSGDTRISFTSISAFPLAEMGCDWHPRVPGHHAIADVVVPVISATLGWDERR